MFERDEPEPPASQSQRTPSSTQHATIEEIVTESIRNALVTFRAPERAPEDQHPHTPGMASRLGISRPMGHNMEEKILRSEYVDLALLLPDNIYQTQAPGLQLRLDDLALGLMGSPVTMARKRKTVIDTFQKGLDAYVAYICW